MYGVANVETSLDKRKRVLLATLRDMGEGWHNRAQIAQKLGKSQLNAVELVALEQLIVSEEIEGQLAPGAQQHVNQWQYRAK